MSYESYETINWELRSGDELARRGQQARDESIQIATKPETATNTLGNIALLYIFGGSIGTIGHLETLVLDGIATTTEVADKLRYE